MKRRSEFVTELPYIVMFLIGVLTYGAAVGILLAEWAVKR
jgi:hypothetical protein